MTKRVDFFYGIGSRYSFLASTRMEALEREAACTVAWRPLVSGVLMQRRGMHPFRQPTPPSGQYDWTYRRYDAECWAAYYGIPYSNDMSIDPRQKLAKDIVLRDGFTVDRIRTEKPKGNKKRRVFSKPTLDHVVPLSRGGADSSENLVLACQACNVPKGSRTPVAPRPPATTSAPGSTSRRMIARPSVRPSTVRIERTVPTSLPPASTLRPSGAPGSRQAMPRSSRLVWPRKWSRATGSCPG